ncbi:hypothetical protein MKW98_010528, partial [Papaver atlanticum]
MLIQLSRNVYNRSPNKLNLGVGAYRTEEGKPLVLNVVRKAEQLLVNVFLLNVIGKLFAAEEISVQNGLKKYDPQKDKHFSGSVKLPHIPRLKMKFSRLADAQQVEEDQKIGVVYMDVEGLKKPNKNKFFVKKLAKKFHLFYPQRLLSSRFLVFLDLVLTTQVYMHVPSDLHFLSFM